MAEEAPLIFKVKVDKKEAKIEISNLQKEFARLGKEASEGLGFVDKFLAKISDLGKEAKGTSKAQKELRTRVNLLRESLKKIALVGGLLAGGLFALGQASAALRVEQAILDFQLRQIGVVIGDSLAPILRTFNEILGFIIDIYQSLSPEQQRFIELAIAATVVVGGLAVVVGVLSTAMIVLMAKFIAIGIVIGLLFFLWETNFLGIQDIVETVVNAIIFVIGLLQFSLELAFGLIGLGLKAMGAGFELVQDLIMGGVNLLIDIFNQLMDIILAIPNAVGEVVGAIEGVPIVGDIVGGVGGILGFQQGGFVPGSANQAVPIIAHGGELILNQSQQATILSLFGENANSSRGGPNTVNNARTVNIGTINLQTGDSESAGLGTGAAGDLARGIRRRGTF